MKRIAVIAKDRKDEALRMAIGLTLADDRVDIFVLDGALEDTEKNRLNRETAELMEIKAYTNTERNTDMELLGTEEIARRLLEYDTILTY
jgi:hypothetical protein